MTMAAGSVKPTKASCADRFEDARFKATTPIAMTAKAAATNTTPSGSPRVAGGLRNIGSMYTGKATSPNSRIHSGSRPRRTRRTASGSTSALCAASNAAGGTSIRGPARAAWALLARPAAILALRSHGGHAEPIRPENGGPIRKPCSVIVALRTGSLGDLAQVLIGGTLAGYATSVITLFT